jgi:hypothetical protein
MPQRIFLTVVVFSFLFCGKIFAQQKNVEKLSIKKEKSFAFPQKISWNNLVFPPAKAGIVLFNKLNNPYSISFPIPFSLRKIYSPVNEDYYCNNLGFLCRKELQIEKITSLPLRFRLGSFEYNDYMERKPNAIFRR